MTTLELSAVEVATMGDVHDEINHLCDLAGIPRPEGGFGVGWTDQDWSNVRAERA